MISGPRHSDEGGEAPCFAHLLDDTSDGVDRVLAQLVLLRCLELRAARGENVIVS
jgi:hypothetical protein